jgi:hypothetical protein
MKALSIQQPWASLVVHGFKRFETRTWPTLFRGRLAIHAAGRFRKSQREHCWQDPYRSCLAEAGIDRLRDLPLGCIVGAVTVADCVPASDLADTIDVRERQFGNFDADRHAWVLTDPMALAEPIPWTGQLGLFDLQEPDIFFELASLAAAPIA